MLMGLWLALESMMPPAFHFVIASSNFSMHLSETVKIRRLLSILISSMVIVWFTSCKGGFLEQEYFGKPLKEVWSILGNDSC
jgi:hypothetical protein